MPDLDRRFPAIPDMERVARRRMPRFMRDYVCGGLGRGTALDRNTRYLDTVTLMPRYLADADEPELSGSFAGTGVAAPFAVAPLGLAGLAWPDCERPIARAACDAGIVHVLSTYATAALEDIRPIAGERAWFQLYPPNRPDDEADLIARTARAGYEVLVVTVDIPAPTRREHDIRNGLTIPPTFGPATLLDIARHPAWALGTLRHGIPRFANLMPYVPAGSGVRDAATRISAMMIGHMTPARLARIRDAWKGRMLVKGLLDPDEAVAVMGLGADGVIVSNHGGRQLDAAPSAAEMLPAMRERLGAEATILADGGVRSGLDIARMMALGADGVLVGRPFLFAAAAMGADGPAHLISVLKAELTATLAQLGCRSPRDLPHHLAAHGAALPGWQT